MLKLLLWTKGANACWRSWRESSGEKMHKRVKRLGAPFDEIYAVQYPRLSWYVHAGLTGVSGLKLESFTALCGVALKSSTDSYEQILLAVIEEFKIGKADDKIKEKLTASKFLPFTNGMAEAEEFSESPSARPFQPASVGFVGPSYFAVQK